MYNNWNWITFFQANTEPAFTLHNTQQARQVMRDHCRKLLNLSFEEGLRIIILSVPRFSHDQWQHFQKELQPHCATVKVERWLHIAQMMMTYSAEVHAIVRHYNLREAMRAAEERLNTAAEVETFAFMACLYCYRQTSLEAKMIFHYLTQKYNQHDQHLQTILRFYQTLTPRQQVVATLTARGLTNGEIAKHLHIETAVVAEHLTKIYGRFVDEMELMPSTHGTRYRLIHWLTRLFEQHPQWMRDPQES